VVKINPDLAKVAAWDTIYKQHRCWSLRVKEFNRFKRSH